MNYCTLDEIKEELKITSEDKDNILQSIIEQVKEFIDGECKRHFDTETATAKYYDGTGSLLFIDDLVLIDVGGLVLDEDGDGTYESTMATTDYILYPLNRYPKTMIEINSNGAYSGFANGVRKGVKITGTWGYAATVPKPIRRAAIMLTCRLFKRRDTAYATVVASTELGKFEVFRGMDADTQAMLNPFIRRGF